MVGFNRIESKMVEMVGIRRVVEAGVVMGGVEMER